MSITINDYTDVFDATSMGASVNGSPLNLYKTTGFAVWASWTGTPVGTVKLQASCDKGTDLVGSGVTHWEDISDASQVTGGAAGTVLFNYTVTPGYNWLRVVYTRTSGTGSLTAKFNGKG